MRCPALRARSLSHSELVVLSWLLLQLPSTLLISLKSVCIIFIVRFRSKLSKWKSSVLRHKLMKINLIVIQFPKLLTWKMLCLHYFPLGLFTTKNIIRRIIKLWRKQLTEIVNSLSLFTDGCLICIHLVLCSQLPVRTIHSFALHNSTRLTAQRLSCRVTGKHWKLQICSAGLCIFFSLDSLCCCFACCLLAYLWGMFQRCSVKEKTLVRLPAISGDFLSSRGTERGKMNWHIVMQQNRIMQKMQSYAKYYWCRAHPWRIQGVVD